MFSFFILVQKLSGSNQIFIFHFSFFVPKGFHIQIPFIIYARGRLFSIIRNLPQYLVAVYHCVLESGLVCFFLPIEISKNVTIS